MGSELLSLYERAQFSGARNASFRSWLDAAEVGGGGCRTRKRWEGVHNMAAGRLNDLRKVSFFLQHDLNVAHFQTDIYLNVAISYPRSSVNRQCCTPAGYFGPYS
jgi:hypothetical protein